MSDTVSRGPAAIASSEDRILAIVIYVLYFVAPFFCGVTALIGAVVAYVRRPLAHGLEGSHYAFQIKILWIFIAVFVVGLLASVIGVLLMIGAQNGPEGIARFFDAPDGNVVFADSWPVGLALTIVGGLAVAADVIWVMLASVFGVVRLLSGEPIGRLKAA